MEDHEKQGVTGYVILISAIAAVGGLLFGYDTAVIGGTIGFLETKFSLDAWGKGFAASSALIGCIIGAMFAGKLGDLFGRKRILILCAIFFVVSAVGSAIPRTVAELNWARILGGLGVGAASMLSPLYISEVAPARSRGRLVALNQLAIVTGIFVVYFVNMFIEHSGTTDWNVQQGWRWMFGSETLPAMLFLILLCFVPESPRWLAKQGRTEQARTILCRVGTPEQAEKDLMRIQTLIKEESGSIFELLRPGMKLALVVGVLLAIFQQITGINAIMYYAPEVFKAAGAGQNAAFIQAVAVGLVNLLFTFVAIALVDKMGRRKLLLIGAALQVVTLGGVGLAYRFPQFGGPWVLVFVLGYVASFAMALGPVPWIIMAEIYPTRIRGAAMSIATFLLWVSCYAVSQTFPVLVKNVGSAGTFWIYGAASVALLVFTWLFVPETKGKTLEEIEAGWLRKAGSAAVGSPSPAEEA